MGVVSARFVPSEMNCHERFHCHDVWNLDRSPSVAHGRARANSPTGSQFRFVALSPRLLSIFPVFPPTHTIRHYAPRATRPAGTPGGLRDLSFDPCDLDFGRPAAARSPRRVGPHHSPWLAGTAFDATARSARLLCLSRSHFAGKAC